MDLYILSNIQRNGNKADVHFIFLNSWSVDWWYFWINQMELVFQERFSESKDWYEMDNMNTH